MLIQWMIRRDMPRVLEIEKLCYKHPWSEGDFIKYLKSNGCIGMTCSVHLDPLDQGVKEPLDQTIVGYMVYILEPQRLNLINIAVHPDFQRKGYGRAMIAKVIDKMGQHRRSSIRTMTHECNLGAQLFLKEMGFRANTVRKDIYKQPDRSFDGYCFSFVPPLESQHEARK